MKEGVEKKEGWMETDWRRVSSGKEAETQSKERNRRRRRRRRRATKNERFQMNRVITSVACWFLSSSLPLPSADAWFSPLRFLPMEELLTYSGARMVAPLLMEFPIFSFPSASSPSSPFPSERLPRPPLSSHRWSIAKLLPLKPPPPPPPLAAATRCALIVVTSLASLTTYATLATLVIASPNFI